MVRGHFFAGHAPHRAHRPHHRQGRPDWSAAMRCSMRRIMAPGAAI